LATTKVTAEMLDNAASVATQAGETVAANLMRLLNEISSQAAVFQGGAGTTFQNVSADLGRELRSMLDALNEMAGKVSQSNKVFGSTDEDAANEIKQIQSDHLPGAGSVANALRG
jgi:WXG100 family type VII secretion target